MDHQSTICWYQSNIDIAAEKFSFAEVTRRQNLVRESRVYSSSALEPHRNDSNAMLVPGQDVYANCSHDRGNRALCHEGPGSTILLT